MFFSIDIRRVDLIDRALLNCPLEVVPNLKPCPVGIGHENHARGTGIVANQVQLFRILIDLKAIGHQDNGIHNGGEFDFVIFALHHNGLFDMNHRESSCFSGMVNILTIAVSMAVRSGMAVLLQVCSKSLRIARHARMRAMGIRLQSR